MSRDAERNAEVGRKRGRERGRREGREGGTESGRERETHHSTGGWVDACAESFCCDVGSLTRTSTMPLACFWNMKSCGTMAMLSKYMENVQAVSDRKSLFSVGWTNCTEAKTTAGSHENKKQVHTRGHTRRKKKKKNDCSHKTKRNKTTSNIPPNTTDISERQPPTNDSDNNSTTTTTTTTTSSSSSPSPARGRVRRCRWYQIPWARAGLQRSRPPSGTWTSAGSTSAPRKPPPGKGRPSPPRGTRSHCHRRRRRLSGGQRALRSPRQRS